MYAFIVTSIDLSQNTISVEIRGVFTHLIPAQYYANHLRETEPDNHVTVKRHQMMDSPTPVSYRLGKPVPAFPQPVGEGVQTDPSLTGSRP